MKLWTVLLAAGTGFSFAQEIPPPAISYSNSIQQIDVNENGFNQNNDTGDFYRVGLRAENISNYGHPISDTCFLLAYGVDLSERSAFNFTDQYVAWTFDANGTGVDYWQFGENVLEPGLDNTVYYDVLAKDVLGWETAQVRLLANAGWSNVSNTPVPITRSMTNENGTSFGWLKDHNLVADTNSTASYEAAALTDTDGDGFANWQEHITDSDPNSSNSFFRITVSDFVLSWHSATGRIYTVKGAINLTDTFTFITNFTGIAGMLSYTNAGTDGFHFYRLEAELTP